MHVDPHSLIFRALTRIIRGDSSAAGVKLQAPARAQRGRAIVSFNGLVRQQRLHMSDIARWADPPSPKVLKSPLTVCVVRHLVPQLPIVSLRQMSHPTVPQGTP
jgi:hypothetical protein